MKKILAVVLSLAMILSMTVVGFAAGEPSDSWSESLWVAYYKGILENDMLDDDAKVAALSSTEPNVEAMAMAIANARSNGDEIEGVVVALNDVLATEYGADLESALNEDINSDGYLGDPANKVVYKPVDAYDVEAWTLYYTIILGDASTNPAAVITVVPEIAGNVTNGEIDLDTFTSAFPAAAAAVGGDVVNQIVWGVEELLSMDLNSDGYIGKPDGSLDDAELPEEDENEGGDSDLLGGLLDTVLGILGGIFDTLLGGGDNGGSTGDPEEPTDDENLWGDDGSDDMWGDNSSSSTIPDTGDTTVFAVAAVALAAGAALVMTRKKSEDAE